MIAFMQTESQLFVFQTCEQFGQFLVSNQPARLSQVSNISPPVQEASSVRHSLRAELEHVALVDRQLC